MSTRCLLEMASQTISFILNDNDLEYLDSYARLKGLSRSSLLRMIVREWIQEKRRTP